MKSKYILSGMLTSAILLASCSPDTDPSPPYNEEKKPSPVVVEMDGVVITEQEWIDEMKQEVGSQVLWELIQIKALETKYTVTDEEVEEKVESVRQSFASIEDYLASLQEAGMKNEDVFYRKTKKELLVFKAMTDGVSVTEEEVLAAYDEMTTQYIVDHLVVEVEETAQEIEQKLADVGTIAALGKPYPYDPSLPAEGLPTAVSAIAPSLSVGESSKSIQTEQGYHFITLVEKKEKGDFPPFEEIKDELRQQLLYERAKPIEPIVDGLIESLNVTVLEDILDVRNQQTYAGGKG